MPKTTTPTLTLQRTELLHRLAEAGLAGLSMASTARRLLSEICPAFLANQGLVTFGSYKQPLTTLAVFQSGEESSLLHPGMLPIPSLCYRARDLCKVLVSHAPNEPSELGCPIRQGRRVLGALFLARADGRHFTIEEQRAILAAAAQSGRVLGHLEELANAGEMTRRFEALVSAAESLIAPEPLPDILKRISTLVQDLLHVPQCTVLLVNDKREMTISATGQGSLSYSSRGNGPLFGTSPTAFGELIPQRNPVQILSLQRKSMESSGTDEKLSQDSPRPTLRSSRTGPLSSNDPSGIHSVPVFFHGEMIGLIMLYGVDRFGLSDGDHRLLDALAGLCGLAIGNAQRFERLLQTDHQLRLDDRLSTLGALGSELAHEIRNPLQTASLLLQSLQEDRILPESRHQDLQIITEKLVHVDRVLSRTLELAQQREPQLAWLEVPRVIDELVLFINHLAATQAVVIHRLEPSGSLPPILMDRSHLDQILLNMVLSALQAMPTGGILGIRIATLTRKVASDSKKIGRRGRPRREDVPPPTAITVAISDTGGGYRPDEISQIFAPFSVSKITGTGLGLFVAKTLAEKHGGQLSIESQLNEGSTLLLELPIDSQPITSSSEQGS
jgi:signal transduction histidine kinase